jgi:hypothetical protein
VDPYLYIFSVQEHIEPASMIKMQMADEDLLNIFEFVSGGLDSSLQLMLWLITNS